MPKYLYLSNGLKSFSFIKAFKPDSICHWSLVGYALKDLFRYNLKEILIKVTISEIIIALFLEMLNLL